MVSRMGGRTAVEGASGGGSIGRYQLPVWWGLFREEGGLRTKGKVRVLTSGTGR